MVGGPGGLQGGPQRPLGDQLRHLAPRHQGGAGGEGPRAPRDPPQVPRPPPAQAVWGQPMELGLPLLPVGARQHGTLVTAGTTPYSFHFKTGNY